MSVLLVECLTCHHRAVLPVPISQPMTTVSKRLKCSRCGSRATQMRRSFRKSEADRFLRRDGPFEEIG